MWAELPRFKFFANEDSTVFLFFLSAIASEAQVYVGPIAGRQLVLEPQPNQRILLLLRYELGHSFLSRTSEPDVVNFSVALSGLGLRWDTLTQASAFATACAVIFRPFRPYFP